MPIWLTIVISVGLFALNRLLAPRLDGPEAETLERPELGEGKAIPLLYGRFEVAPRVVWFGNVTKKKVSSGRFTMWYAQIHAIVGWGPVDELTDLTFDKKSLRYASGAIRNLGGIALGAVPSSVPSFPRTRGASAFERILVSAYDLFGGLEEEGGVEGLVEFHWGVDTPTVAPLVTEYAGAANASGYPRVAHILFGLPASLDPTTIAAYAPTGRGFYWAANSPFIRPVRVLGRRCPNPAALGLAPSVAVIDGECNPVCVLYELLTDPILGVGRAPGEVDTANFAAVAATLAAEGFAVSNQLMEPTDAESVIADLLDTIDAALRTNPVTGLLELKLARADYTLAALPAITPSVAWDIALTRVQWPETINEVTVRYRRYEVGATITPGDEGASGVKVGFVDATVTVQNQANAQATGGLRSLTARFPWITREALALRAAERLLRARSIPIATVRWKMHRAGAALAPGDVVRVTEPLLGIVDMPVRIGSVDAGTLEEGVMEVSGVEDVFGLALGTFTPPPPTLWTDPVARTSGWGGSWGADWGGTA